MTTYQDVIESAVARSTKNRSGVIATEGVELLAVAARAMSGAFAFAARVNPLFFAKRVGVVQTGGAWARPSDAELVFRIEDAGGTEIIVVPFDDRAADLSRGAVFRVGQVYYPASVNAPDPQAGTLTFWYSARPAVPAAITDALPANWPDAYNDLPSLSVAMYLAMKDGRTDEAAALANQLQAASTLFTAFMEHETANEVRRFGFAGKFSVPSLVPLFSLLAGGAPPPTS